jgi:hypothetical protein
MEEFPAQRAQTPLPTGISTDAVRGTIVIL